MLDVLERGVIVEVSAPIVLTQDELAVILAIRAARRETVGTRHIVLKVESRRIGISRCDAPRWHDKT